MAEQWIDAATAVLLVAEVTSPPHLAREALCKRAYAGSVRAKARVFIAGRHPPLKDSAVPQGFWWAKGQAALKQNWEVGDFSTWIEKKDEWRAFGVTFAASDLLEVLPSQQRALAARRLSVAGDAAWMPAHDASRMAVTALTAVRPTSVILEQARLGLVAGRAIVAQRFAHQHASEAIWEEREWDIPVAFWEDCVKLDDVYQNWSLGRFSARHGPGTAEWMTLSGVHFLTASIEAVTGKPAAPTQEVEAPAKSRPGGRLPQPWWDDMWCDVWRLIYQGDFKPESQADVERAMLTWAERNGRNLAEATARPKARKLFRAYSGEGTNFLAD